MLLMVIILFQLLLATVQTLLQIPRIILELHQIANAQNRNHLLLMENVQFAIHKILSMIIPTINVLAVHRIHTLVRYPILVRSTLHKMMGIVQEEGSKVLMASACAQLLFPFGMETNVSNVFYQNISISITKLVWHAQEVTSMMWILVFQLIVHRPKFLMS